MTQYYKIIERQTGRVLYYMAHEVGVIPENDSSIVYVPVTKEEYDAAVAAAMNDETAQDEDIGAFAEDD